MAVVVLLALAMPGGLLLFQKEAPISLSGQGGLTRHEAIQLAVKMMPGFSSDGVSNIFAVRTTLGKVEDALETGTSRGKGQQVWVVSMRGTFIWPNPPGSPARPYNNAYIVVDALTGRRMMTGSLTAGQFILPPR